MTTTPQQPTVKQLVAAGTIRRTRDGARTITTTATPAGVSGRITPAGGAR
ncbi:hypothetical protein [Streptomyces atratus]